MQDYAKELQTQYDTNKKAYEALDANFATLQEQMEEAEYNGEEAATEAEAA
jgi:predicted phage tail protein